MSQSDLPRLPDPDDACESARGGNEPPVDLLYLPGGVVIVRRAPIPLRRRFRSLSSRPDVSGVTQTFQVNLLED
jgi:hypothetical protein